MDTKEKPAEANTMNIYQRLHAVMGEVSYVQKTDKKVNNQYTFVSHDAVTAKVRPALLKHGVLSIPQNLKFSQDGNRTEVSLDMTFVNIDQPDDRIMVPSFGYGIDPQDKGPGKAISYAVKYALLKALGLETGDDPERDHVDHVKPPEITREHKIFQRDFLYDLNASDDVKSTLDKHAAGFEGLPEPITDQINDAIKIREDQIANRITVSPKFGYIDVAEAVEFFETAKKYTKGARDVKMLSAWMLENDHKLKALDGVLSAAKYQTNGVSPYQTVINLYNARFKSEE